MRKLISILSLLLVTSLFFSCASNKKKIGYKIITTQQAEKMQKHFTVTKPKDWIIYTESHGFLIYSPLGVKFTRKFNFSEKVISPKKAKKIFLHNKNNTKKKGYFNDNYLKIDSYDKDSLNINSYKELINWYKKNQYERFGKDFNYKIIKKQNSNYGQMIYLEYDTEYFFRKRHLDILMLFDGRIYTFSYNSDENLYDLYLDDALKIIKSLKSKNASTQPQES